MKSLVAIAIAGIAMAPCFWDSDTLDTELRGLPDAFDLVIGRWHRHSDAYYEARIARIATSHQQTLAGCDDLAVAYEHLGRRSDAMAVMTDKARLLAETPDEEHQYRYHANLGTFLAHDGRYEEALVELRKAIAINPDAHFGRERFQIELIEYVAAAKKNPSLWARHSFLRHAGYQLRTPWLSIDSLAATDGASANSESRNLDWDAAFKAVGGMLRFGGFEGPELYRSLGDLFLEKEHLNLAWWSFGVAIERGHPALDGLARIRRNIENHWNDARKHNRSSHTNPTERDYHEERAKADAWLAAFQEAEERAIDAGEPVEGDEALRRLLKVADESLATTTGGDVHVGSSWRSMAQWSLVVLALLLLAYILRLRSRT